MALKDHSLDDKITAAAMKEFSAKGYNGASLRKIAEGAGVTVGAIQTRYKSKDALFAGLLKPLLDDISATFQSVKADYYSGSDGDLAAQLKVSMQHESKAILHLIFAHYDEALLLFFRNAGSSMEHYFDAVVKSKRVYRELVEQADDIGDDNPMAYNELFALAFVAPYVASDKNIPPETVQEMMRRSLYHIKWYFARTDLNTAKGKAENKRASSNTPSGTRPKRKRSTLPPSRSTLSVSPMRARATTASPVARSAPMQTSSAYGS